MAKDVMPEQEKKGSWYSDRLAHTFAAINLSGSIDTGRYVRMTWVVLAVLVSSYALGSFVVRQSMYSDSGWGFLVLDSMTFKGAPFNSILEPDPRDISKDLPRFMAAWSPGQYLAPGFLETIGLDMGQSITAVVFLFSVLGLVGWYQLYRIWLFPAGSAAIATALMASTRAFALPFGIYNGGEVLLFGVAPWFLLTLWAVQRWNWWRVPVVLVALLALAVAKLSGLILAVAAIGALRIPELWPLDRVKMRNLAIDAVAGLVFTGLFYYFWLSRGWTAVSDSGTFYPYHLVSHSLGSIGAAGTAMFSIGDFAARLLQFPGSALVSSLDWLYILMAAPVLTLLLWMYKSLLRSHPGYLRFALLSCAIFVVITTLIFARGGAIQLEDRRFRMVALILLIGLVHTIRQRRGLPVVLAALFAICMATYGISSYFVRLKHNLALPLGERGFRHAIVSREALEFVKGELARSGNKEDTLVVVTSPEIGLECKSVRVLSNHADFESEELLRGRTYHGRVGKIVVLVQTTLVLGGKADIILSSFSDYPRVGWVPTPVGSFTYFVQ